MKPDVTPIFPWPFLWIAYIVLFCVGAVSVSVFVPVYWCCVGRWRCAVGKAAKQLKLAQTAGSERDKLVSGIGTKEHKQGTRV